MYSSAVVVLGHDDPRPRNRTPTTPMDVVKGDQGITPGYHQQHPFEYLSLIKITIGRPRPAGGRAYRLMKKYSSIKTAEIIIK